MSRTPIASLAGVVFIFAYMAVAVLIPEWVGRMHWAVEAVYWAIAGLLWVLPIRWLMLWSVGKR